MIPFPRSKNSLSTLLESKKTTWPDPEKSVGKITKVDVKGFVCFEAVGSALDAFHQISSPIKDLLDGHREQMEAGEEKTHTVAFYMWMIGRERSSVRPTIVFSSQSKRQRQMAKALVKESNILDQFPGVELKTLERMPAVPRAADINLKTTFDDNENDIYITRSASDACGASICFGGSQKATLGGVILIDNVYHGISVLHHCVNAIEEQDIATGRTKQLVFDDDNESDFADDDFIEVTSTGKSRLIAVSGVIEA